MNEATQQIRMKLKDLGWASSDTGKDGDALTVCQFIVVGLSLLSVVFLLAPLFYVQQIWFMIIFFSFSTVSLFAGIWFWMRQAEICEHPDLYLD